MKATYQNIPTLLAQKEEFRGNSITAHWNSVGSLAQCDYEVYSYSTLIFRLPGEDSQSKPYFNTKKYSVTTSRLQNIIRDVFDLP